MMAGRRLQALCLVLVMLSSTVAAPASAQTTDPKQPSVENPHMHFWGTSQMDQCWTHFDRNGSDGSSQDGYGEKEFTGNGIIFPVDSSLPSSFVQIRFTTPNNAQGTSTHT